MIHDDELLTALQPFLDEGLITEVVATLQRGKEATVYCCRAHPSTGRELFAVKVYRPHAASAFRSRAIYKQGRERAHRPNPRTMRAIRAKTAFGHRAARGDWIYQEYENLQLLNAAGGDVPQPFAVEDSSILMDYIGNEATPAPLLLGAELPPGKAQRAFDRVMRNVELFLVEDRIHGDLSPYNILYWNEQITVIDLPQMVDPRFNPSAFSLLQRDIENVVKFFGKYGVKASASAIAINLWKRYMRATL
jgi:RIO kinase 1